ncbi:hypothetical protein GCE86_24315 [Micromonospora terminaliae]|uniref:Uncharacterized protein n=1 Tax=Micromonospora terminaliae TaxID=1914461 RepID=A0AAJ3DMU7_9ACTN|nr:hypothetical protein [Micromonospora terminaliae]NES31788.1 hypothetical protein [Micromonospora terminaliae]QGL49877.1 hypothetical protein GCE86_24315 [Micromonospora terminaliae]
MPERHNVDRESRGLDSHLEGSLPGLDTMLRDAAGDAARRAIVPSYDLVRGTARGRRTARVATAGVFGTVLFLVIGMAAVTGAGPGRHEDRPPAASATTLDPSLRGYWTRIPILTWTPEASREASEVSSTNEFLTAVFSALAPGDHDYSNLPDLRKLFPDAPTGGPAVAIHQSVTRAELERAAANLRKLDGVQDARVVEVRGLWFTVSATAPAASGSGLPPVIDVTGTGAKGSASGQRRDAQNRWVIWVRATYFGPAIDRATFDLLRTRTAEAVHVDVSQVVVTAESSVRKPKPTTS